MKKQIGLIIKIVVALFIVCMLVWRFLPQSFSDLISIDKTSVTNFSASARVQRLENGEIHTDTYSINTEQHGNRSGDVIDILATSRYKQDFRNLLPWSADSVEADKNYDGRNLVLVFSVGNQKDEWLHIHYLSSSIIAVSVGTEDGFRIYHPTNRKTLDELTEYFQAHGIKQ